MFESISSITVEALKARTTLIHFFGLGFIQVKLGTEWRMHFYAPELPPIVQKEDVHDHRYPFVSTVLAGGFTQELFAVVPGTTHVLEDESCTAGKASITPPQPCALVRLSKERYAAGSRYSLAADAFHRVSATDAITLLRRGRKAKEFARVARLAGSPRICAFSKQIPEAELWEIVERMLVRSR